MGCGCVAIFLFFFFFFHDKSWRLRIRYQDMARGKGGHAKRMGRTLKIGFDCMVGVGRGLILMMFAEVTAQP